MDSSSSCRCLWLGYIDLVVLQMKVKDLKDILNKYPDDCALKVDYTLGRIRLCVRVKLKNKILKTFPILFVNSRIIISSLDYCMPLKEEIEDFKNERT